MSAEHDTEAVEAARRVIDGLNGSEDGISFNDVETVCRAYLSLLSRVENARDEVLEAAAKVADGLDGCGGGYGDYPSGWDHACSHIAESIRSLKDKP